MNGVLATSQLQALGELLFLLAISLVMNDGVAAVRALVWLLAGKLLSKAEAFEIAE